MAYYNYKLVLDQLPPFITDAIHGYDGDANFNGDQWIAAHNYISLLEAELIGLARRGNTVADDRLRAWLSERIAAAGSPSDTLTP